MAQLYGRVCRVPNRHLIGAALVLALLWSTGSAWAQEATAEGEEYGTRLGEVEAWAADLASDDPATRESACDALSTLEEEALPAIRQRVETFARPRFDTEEAYRTINRFRHAVGSLRADDDVDVIPGLPTVLSEDREPMTVALVERRLLARSLVDMATIEAAPVLGDIIATDPHAWRWEWRRMVWRLGHRALPMLLILEDHSDAGVRRWARWGLREIDLQEPGRAIQTDDMRLLAEIIRAYGTVRDMDAMRVVVGFVVHERAQVRNAARWATDRYGRNAIWQLRRVYRNLTGEHADQSLGWEATAAMLYSAHDAQRLAPVREDLEAGLAALATGDLDGMQAKFDEVLIAAPDLPQRAQLAPGYAALGARALEAGDVGEAERFYRRALRLSPTHESAGSWRAEVQFIEAEERLASGIADLGAYQQVLLHDPNHHGALAFIMAADGDGPAGDGLPLKRIGLALAVLIFLGVFGTLWIRGREEEEMDGDVDPELVDPDPDTIPG
jgi:hypothetical protein